MGWEEDLLKDLENAVQRAADLPEGELVAAVKSDPNLDLSNLTDREMNDLLAVAGIGQGGLPDRMADINGILDTLDATSREKILTSFVNDLFTQSEF